MSTVTKDSEFPKGYLDGEGTFSWQVVGAGLSYFVSVPLKDALGRVKRDGFGNEITVDTREEATMGQLVELNWVQAERLLGEGAIQVPGSGLLANDPRKPVIATPFGVPLGVGAVGHSADENNPMPGGGQAQDTIAQQDAAVSNAAAAEIQRQQAELLARLAEEDKAAESFGIEPNEAPIPVPEKLAQNPVSGGDAPLIQVPPAADSAATAESAQPGADTPPAAEPEDDTASSVTEWIESKPTAADVVAYASDHPEDIPEIIAAEKATQGDKARKTILDLVPSTDE